MHQVQDYGFPRWVSHPVEQVLLPCAEPPSWWFPFQSCTQSHRSQHKKQNTNMVRCLWTKSVKLFEDKSRTGLNNPNMYKYIYRENNSLGFLKKCWNGSVPLLSRTRMGYFTDALYLLCLFTLSLMQKQLSFVQIMFYIMYFTKCKNLVWY